jgi:hypothetical protein
MRFQSIIVSIAHPSPPSGSCPGEDQHVYIHRRRQRFARNSPHASHYI